MTTKRGQKNFSQGVIASSGAVRLKPEGIFVKNRLSAADWFLNEQDDVRSCHFLEDVATEFDIQGLEFDWCLVAWDADYRYVNGQFEHWKFTGTTWKRRQQEEQQRYLENAYRVLLIRARQGMVFFVTLGNAEDATRVPRTSG
ncbi:DNA/RNA helicase domain-containing protein [Undibacterium sp. RuTC16W]|uniref:DNA/RNA helicase domain-containing protein n=1 Tax=Undibacterium sp. RuTC16W TaxID=3413048 RepID=UPI003BF34042